MLLYSTSKSFNCIFKVILKYGCYVFDVGKTAELLCYGHKSSTGTVRRLFHQTSYDSTALVRRPSGGRNNRTIFLSRF